MKWMTVLMLLTAGFKVLAVNTYYVDNTLSTYEDADGTKDRPFQKIQDAVNKAVNGDIVLVRPGIYGEDQGVVVDKIETTPDNVYYSYMPNRVWIHNKHITIKSTDGAAVTHIVGRHSVEDGAMGDDSVRCIAMSGNGNIGGTRIEGFTIRDGATQKLNAGKTIGGKACETSHCGGGLVFKYTSGGNGANIHIVDCVVSNCVAAQGAAAYGVSFIRSRIEKCYSGSANGSTVTQCNAVNSIFAGNGMVEYEGTMRSVEKNYPVSAVNCTFWDNRGMLRGPGGGVPAPSIVNSIIQRNTGNDGNSIVADGTKIWYCIADVSGIVDCNRQDGVAINVAMATYEQNAILAAPLFGDFRPVARSAARNVFGIANKSKYIEFITWVPESDRDKDIAHEARWNENDEMTPGAYQNGIDVGAGCITITSGTFGFRVDGKTYDRPDNAYFYASANPEQHRIAFTSDTEDLEHAWLDGYVDGCCRFPNVEGDIILTAPSKSELTTLRVEARAAERVLWVDASNTQDGCNGSYANPYRSIQDAVDVVADGRRTLIKVRKGEYKSGGGYYSGNARVFVPQGKSIQIRAVDGPSETFICGGEATRCVNVEVASSGSPEAIGFVGFTLKDGRTATSKAGELAEVLYGGAIFANSDVLAQFVDCLITDCRGVRGSAAYQCWLQNCRVCNCSHLTSNDQGSRGVVYKTFLSSCVIGPNEFKTVSVDQNSKLWNVSIVETLRVQHLSADAYVYNTIDLNAWMQPNPNSGREFFNCAFEVTNPNGIVFEPTVELTENPLVGDAKGDFRPKVGTSVVGAGVSIDNADFVQYTVGGFYHEVFSGGSFPIGASSDVAIPVTIKNKSGVSIEGALDVGWVSSASPLKFVATLMNRRFYGWKLNGADEFSSCERVLTLTPTNGVTAYSVEGCYEKLGVVLVVR